MGCSSSRPEAKVAQPYPYSPLHASEHQIRLLTLFPEEFASNTKDASPIEIEFQTISFSGVDSQASPRLEIDQSSKK
jgi:hypothetical protein